MKTVRSLAIGALLAVASGTATMAFDVQQGAKAPAASAEKAAPAGAGSDLGANLAIESGKAPTGTEVRIPGLGRLGVLPKMDFGLELLYGAADPKRPEEPVDRSDDLVVRGTVKHRF